MPTGALKLIAYNILDGGLGRLDPICETLRFLDGDVIGLCEADDSDAVRYLEEKLQVESIRMEGSSGHAVALLTRGRIQSSMNLSIAVPLLDRGALESTVRFDETEMRCVVVHLQAGQTKEDEQKRLAQVSELFDHLDSKTPPDVIMGDFNAASPHHAFDMTCASPRVRETLIGRGLHAQESDTIRSILDRRWMDPYHVCGGDPNQHTYTTGFPTTRFDYIFFHPRWSDRMIASGIEQRGFAPYCSDHYPVWAQCRG